MFGFRRKKRQQAPTETANTFVEATGGGWDNIPGAVAANGGSQVSFVETTLTRAHSYAVENDIKVGEEFVFTITDIPLGISSPHEITFGLLMRAEEYGLRAGAMVNEEVHFTRLA